MRGFEWPEGSKLGDLPGGGNVYGRVEDEQTEPTKVIPAETVAELVPVPLSTRAARVLDLLTPAWRWLLGLELDEVAHDLARALGDGTTDSLKEWLEGERPTDLKVAAVTEYVAEIKRELGWS